MLLRTPEVVEGELGFKILKVLLRVVSHYSSPPLSLSRLESVGFQRGSLEGNAVSPDSEDVSGEAVSDEGASSEDSLRLACSALAGVCIRRCPSFSTHG